MWAPQGQFSIRRIIYVGNNYVDVEEENEADDTGENQNEGEANNASSINTDKNSNGTDDPNEEKDEEEKDEENEETFVNSAPDAEIRIDGKYVKKGQNYGIDEVLVFEASESWDPDGDALVYSWNFGDGSGSMKSIQAHAYDTPGEYRVKLTVQDPHGLTNQISRLITIGKLPEPVIVYPWESLQFKVGDEIQLYGHATDGDGNYLDDSDLIWEVRQVHNTHYHPFLDPTKGNMIKAPPAPSPEDFLASTNSFLRVMLTATDPKTNLTGTIVRDIQPETKTLYFATDPPGLELTLDGFVVKTPEEEGVPLEVVTWINHNLTVNVKDQGGMVFQSWSDGAKERYSKIVILRDPKKNNAAAEDEARIIKTARFVVPQQLETGPLETGVIDIAEKSENDEASEPPTLEGDVDIAEKSENDEVSQPSTLGWDLTPSASSVQWKGKTFANFSFIRRWRSNPVP